MADGTGDDVTRRIKDTVRSQVLAVTDLVNGKEKRPALSGRTNPMPLPKALNCRLPDAEELNRLRRPAARRWP